MTLHDKLHAVAELGDRDPVNLEAVLARFALHVIETEQSIDGVSGSAGPHVRAIARLARDLGVVDG